jgi:hypothetical protein
VALVADHKPDALEAADFGVFGTAEWAGFEVARHWFVSVLVPYTYYGKKRIASIITEKYGKMFLENA